MLNFICLLLIRITPLNSFAMPSDATPCPSTEQHVYDVFLCHNSEDKSAIWEIYDRLCERGLRPWIDEEDLTPGRFWLDELGQQVKPRG
jgi:TIR domain